MRRGGAGGAERGWYLMDVSGGSEARGRHGWNATPGGDFSLERERQQRPALLVGFVC